MQVALTDFYEERSHNQLNGNNNPQLLLTASQNTFHAGQRAGSNTDLLSSFEIRMGFRSECIYRGP